jgi:hypothetical protein
LAEIVAKFVGDLNNAPTTIRVSAWVDGFWLKDEQISLSDFVLRRPSTVVKLQESRTVTIEIFFAPFAPFYGKMISCSLTK